MSSLAKHIIHRPKPYRVALLILLAMVITYAVQDYLYKNEQQESTQKDLQFNTLEQKYIQLESQNTQLLERYFELDSKAQSQHYDLAIQQATLEQLQLQQIDLQNQLMTANKELVFYQNITQGFSSSKLQIREFTLSSQTHSPNIIAYRAVITQGKKIKKPLKGNMIITLNMADSDTPKLVADLALNLRYVQVFEGQIKLTDQEIPKSINITLKQGKNTPLSQIFDWQIDNK